MMHSPNVTLPQAARPIAYPPELPICERREEIVRAIQAHQVLVITGETGSGKSTQIPKMCLEAGRGTDRLIGCTQPRRIAAITLAARVAEEMGAPRLVGYKIRFQDRTARSTRIKFMTDGILLAEAQRDRLFRAYDTLIIDEAHERTLNIDFLLGLLKQILPRRPDLKVIITSATIDPEKFSRAFGDAPIIEVSGRMYPVEVRYRPPEPTDDDEEATYVDRAIAAVDSLKREARGDILIFMPTESDIRETVQRLEEKRHRHTLVFPLFGRMAAADQQRIFRDTAEEKIIVSTNVAETSLTIPRIRFVIDTGLARIAQYNARTRTQGLPVAPISQSSADQRKGRCGRVASGVCIRLYSEEDYLNRPEFTPPEIQRSNLAEVILRMLLLRLGNIQEFPFLDPPSPAAIKDGFAVLGELSAVDEHRRLTALGRQMAQLPLDPRLSRILIQGSREGALQEMMILAAVLSIQDPRERPMELEAQADQAHAAFRDKRSDFVGLLKIWHACWRGGLSYGTADEGVAALPESEAALPSRGQVRRFCKERFLSYRRMREWRDIYEEIEKIFPEMEGFAVNPSPASYAAIHRSIVSGYLSHIALRKDKNLYLATKNRQAMLFPGSGVFNRGGAWIVAAELVQTSRLFARIVATIEPEWLEEMGKHLCRSNYSEPHWEKKRGQVVAFERVTLYGLTIVERRKVNFGRIDPAAAREIFIRAALVEGDLPGRYGFLEHNQALVRQIEELESKARRRDLLVDEEALYRFYDARLPEFSDIRSFNAFLKAQGDACLRMRESDLLQAAPDFAALEQFPDTIEAGGVVLPLSYAFEPSEEADGVTVTLPVHLVGQLAPGLFEWLVPGLLPEKVTLLIKTLPKALRRPLVPVGETAQRLLGCLDFGRGSLLGQLSECVKAVSGVSVSADQWDLSALPDHLRMRFAVVGPEGNLLGAGRDLEALKPLAASRHEDGLWEAARLQWEKSGARSWEFGELPQRVEIGTDALGLARFAYPGLVDEGDSVGVRLFESPECAREESRKGLLRLFFLHFGSELKGLLRDWVFPESLAPLTFFMGSRKEANAALQDYLVREIFGLHHPQWPERSRFEAMVRALTGGRLGALGRELLDEVSVVIRDRESTRSELARFQKMASGNGATLRQLEVVVRELNALVPGDFLVHYQREAIQQLPRYLRGLRLRGQRVYTAPEKDRLKAEPLEPLTQLYEALRREERPDEEAERFCDEFRWMLEELKISLFAPEVKTRYRVSAKRLEDKWQEWQSQRALRG